MKIIIRHHGPGIHKSGTPQSVHGKGGMSKWKAAEEESRKSAGTVGGSNASPRRSFLEAVEIGRITGERKLDRGGITKPDLIDLENDGQAVWKDARQDSTFMPQSEYQPGASPGDMEVAAYRVSKLLGFQHIEVPETAYLSKDGEIGSAQRFIENAVDGLHAEYGAAKRTISYQEKAEMNVLDFIIGNQDRHEGNYLYADGGFGKCYSIDHGYSVPRGYALPRNGVTLRNLSEQSKVAIRHLTEQEFRAAASNLQKSWQDNMWDTIMQMQFDLRPQ